MYALHVGAVFNLYPEVVNGVPGHLLCQRTKVDVRAGFDNRRRHLLMARPLLHGVGNPALDLVEVF